MKKIEALPFVALLATILFAVPPSVWSAERADSTSENKTTVYGEIKQDATDETLKQLLTVPGVGDQYKKCQADSSVKLADMSKCIWEGLSPDIKKQVQAMYAQETEAKGSARSPASDNLQTSNLTNKSKDLGEDYMSDPAVVELSEIMRKKLEEALIGDKEFQKDKKTIAVVDHAKFIELYRTELGKTIVNAFTSYCVEADIKASESLSVSTCKDTENPAGACPLFILSSEDDKKDVISANLKSLRAANLKSNTETATNSESVKWSRCIASVSNVCYTPIDSFAGKKGDITKQVERSKIRACTIMDYVKSARKNLIAADKQKEYYETLGPGVALRVDNAKNVEITEKNSMDTVTTVTSKDVENSYQSKNEALKKEMDKCMDESEKIIDVESCKKFISTDTDAKEKALTEFGIRQFALEEKIKEKFEDKGEIEKYLKEEGYDKNKIAEMIKSDEALKTVKDEIRERYKNEREAIIASMAEKIQSKTTKEDGKIDDQTGSDDQKNIAKIRSELSSRSDDLKQLVHFNNVVSSYLEIEKGSGQKSRNVASLFAEINNGAKSFRDIDQEQIKDIKKNAADAGLKADKGDNPTELSVDNLNGIFKYSTEE